jgi:hypothetical protein
VRRTYTTGGGNPSGCNGLSGAASYISTTTISNIQQENNSKTADFPNNYKEGTTSGNTGQAGQEEGHTNLIGSH